MKIIIVLLSFMATLLFSLLSAVNWEKYGTLLIISVVSLLFVSVIFHKSEERN